MKKILVIRNDKIGDFMLAWAAFAMLKKSMPNCQIIALVPKYTAPLAEICPYLDGIILDSSDKQNKAENERVLQAVRSAQFDAVISFVSDWYNAKLVWKSRIVYRLAPATKLFQFLYNHRLTQRRSRSEKAEYEYNLDLVRYFLKDNQITAIEPTTPYLSFDNECLNMQKSKLMELLKLDGNKKWLFVHSSTGGSATNLSLNQYAELISGILAKFDCQVILTAGPNESETAQALQQLVNHKNVVIYDKNDGLVDFAKSLACADLFIAGSTGPLHICGALNIATVGFYPSRLSAIPRRWKPLNDADKHIAFCPPSDKASQKNLTLIPMDKALTEILPFMRQIMDNKKL
ncbi:glycosyltransferase family 9 protein [Glaesserella parasuis]|uniref:glycosyltransferase family 9 protein n=1 Tax=Glaesserella parasuis TaxID=738 RepID=UPI0024370625|nr:glycosyltransferase family 9 protein [Glaesserella parasuis]MDG6338931.1 glycosyltransferase family 9 protein [Glaesserella parasuis]